MRDRELGDDEISNIRISDVCLGCITCSGSCVACIAVTGIVDGDGSDKLRLGSCSRCKCLRAIDLHGVLRGSCQEGVQAMAKVVY